MSAMPRKSGVPFAVVRQRTVWLLRALPLLAAVLALGGWLGQRFHLGIDDQAERCLPGTSRWFVIDRHDQNVWRGDLVAFAADARMAPWFTPGRIIVKRATGVGGDRVTVDPQRTTVNGQTVGEGLALSTTLGKPPAALTRQLHVPGHALWVSGTHPRSFDSRYWGVVDESALIGKVYALPF